MKKSFFLQPLHMLDVAIIFSKSIANWHASRPMDPCHGDPSPSDPIESVCRHFPPFHYTMIIMIAMMIIIIIIIIKTLLKES